MCFEYIKEETQVAVQMGGGYARNDVKSKKAYYI
jgi:hypothetical protein